MMSFKCANKKKPNKNDEDMVQGIALFFKTYSLKTKLLIIFKYKYVMGTCFVIFILNYLTKLFRHFL